MSSIILLFLLLCNLVSFPICNAFLYQYSKPSSITNFINHENYCSPINKQKYNSRVILKIHVTQQLYPQSIIEIPRVSKTDFSPDQHYFHQIRIPSNNNVNEGTFLPYETPVIIENIFNTDECECLCEAISSMWGKTEIEIQRKRRTFASNSDSDIINKHYDNHQKEATNKNYHDLQTQTDIYPCTLNQAFQLIMQSNHDDSFFAFCEGLLDEINISEIQTDSSKYNNGEDCYHDHHLIKEALYKAREQFFPSKTIQSNDEHDSDDWFPYFPQSIQPTDCVILAGEGSTSTLHRDPFEWTGTSICLEGTKLWRFIPPPVASMATTTKQIKSTSDDNNKYQNEIWSNLSNEYDDTSKVKWIDEFLQAYRLESVAWEVEQEHKQDDEYIPNTNSIYNRLTLSAGWQSDKSFYTNRMNGIKSARNLADMDDQSKYEYLKAIAMNTDALCGNVFSDKEELQNHQKMQYNPPKNTIWTTLQKPGDLLIIPAYWWHQTYAFEPSLAIASQRCGSNRDARRVMKHMLETSGAKKDMFDLLNEIPSVTKPQKYLKLFFNRLFKT